jgi:hypothetical protein
MMYNNNVYRGAEIVKLSTASSRTSPAAHYRLFAQETSSAPRPGKKRNILFFAADDLRPQHDLPWRV